MTLLDDTGTGVTDNAQDGAVSPAASAEYQRNPSGHYLPVDAGCKALRQLPHGVIDPSPAAQSPARASRNHQVHHETWQQPLLAGAFP